MQEAVPLSEEEIEADLDVERMFDKSKKKKVRMIGYYIVLLIVCERDQLRAQLAAVGFLHLYCCQLPLVGLAHKLSKGN